ncbi:unnamed protein product [Lymnaea stagnalis]|uniref:EF-hand domain-containing protein n=1 Tax=Lymnaea stagnalis TaxID=6523 RepID=A0AAV2HQU2_LYMST
MTLRMSDFGSMDEARVRAMKIKSLSPEGSKNSLYDVTLNADDKLGGEDDDVKRTATGQHGVDLTGAAAEEVQAKPKRREVVKKSKVEKSLIITPPQSPPRLPSPPPFKRRSPTPPSPPPPQSQAPEIEEPPLPAIDIPEVPDLPEITEKAPVEKKKQKQKFIVEPPPQPHVKDTPKRRKTAPKIRLVPRNLSRPRKSRPAEAPITAEDLNDIQDPLDFLAKYCIINPDRLPFYEVVFEATIVEQVPRYTKPAPWEQPEKPQAAESEGVEEEAGAENPVDEKAGTKKKGKSKKTKLAAVKKEPPVLNAALLPTEQGMNLEKVAMTLEEQHLEKLIYTLDMLQDKMNMLGGQLEELEAKRTELIAQKARQRFPEIASPNYLPKKKKKGKKGNKKNKHASEETPRKFHPEEITDDIVVSRLEDKLLNEMCREPDLKMLESEIEIRKLKARDIQNRVEQIASEKLLADAFCMNHYFLRQGASNNMPEHYRRQQSELYNRLRPNPDFEMNLEEVEEALQQINNHLLTEKEFYFLYNVLNLPGRERINFRLFTIIAALSEKVTQLDPVIRKLINNFNYNALDIKMEKCKELFELLESEHMPKGAAQAASLAVELTAGGLRPEHTRYVLNKFNRDSKGIIDFLDFVTYVPLFVEIHKRIINNPLSERFDL